MRNSHLSTSGIRKVSAKEDRFARTAQYVSVNDSEKSLVVAMADMDLISSYPYSDQHWIDVIHHAEPKCLVVDANLSGDTIQSILSVAGGIKTVFEPVSVAKSTRLFGGPKRLGVYPNHLVDLATPNIYELSAMYDAALERGYFHDAPDWAEVIDRFNLRSGDVDYQGHFERMMAGLSDEVKAAGIPQKLLHLLPYIPSIVVKLGDQGCILAEIMAPDDERLLRSWAPGEKTGDIRPQPYVLSRAVSGVRDGGVGGVFMRHSRPQKASDIVSVNGVGDTFLGVLVAGLARGVKVHKMIHTAQLAAVMTLGSSEAVSPDLRKLHRWASRKNASWWVEGWRSTAPAREMRSSLPQGIEPSDTESVEVMTLDDVGIVDGWAETEAEARAGDIVESDSGTAKGQRWGSFARRVLDDASSMTRK